MKTYMAKPEKVERKWYLVDADGIALGRIASQVAAILRGKNKPIFTPHVDTGDHVVIINSDKAILTGKKLDQKFHRSHSFKPGNLKETAYRKYMAEKSDEAMYEAIQGMLPKGPLGRKMLKKVRIYKGAEHEQTAQCPEKLDLTVKSYQS